MPGFHKTVETWKGDPKDVYVKGMTAPMVAYVEEYLEIYDKEPDSE